MSKIGMTVDISQFEQAMREKSFTSDDMVQAGGAGAKEVINIQRTLVPKDTTATMQSIDSHIVEASPTKYTDDIGPETDYSAYIEYGTGEFAEGGKGRKGGWRYKDAHGQWHFTFGMHPQPYVRPSVSGAYASRIITAIHIAIAILIRSK